MNAIDARPDEPVGRSKKLQVCVIGDGEATGATAVAAEQIGCRIAEMGAVLVTGGHGGVMEAACKGAASRGGVCVGILRSGNLSDANRYCNVVIGTDIQHARNTLTVLSSDVVIAIGGGAGTLSEICFAWIYGRPIFILRGFGGWSDRLDEKEPFDSRRKAPIHFCNSVADLFATLEIFLQRK